ncbi:transposase [Streptomyces sp. SID8377]|nr:transposase [Streptomyces sp. SID8377]
MRPLLPHAETGRKRLDDRMVLNEIVWKFRTGSAWRDVPERYGSWATLHPVPPVGCRRHLRPDAAGRPGEGGCGRGRRLDGVRRLHHRASPPACRRGTKRCPYGLRQAAVGVGGS